MVLSNPITGFFDHLYPWKETVSDLDFMHRDFQEEIEFTKDR